MSPKYWTGIFVGMLAVFGVGMLVARGWDRGKALVMDNYPASLSMFSGGFRVDGNRMGDVQRLQFMRSVPGRVDSTIVTVKAETASTDSAIDHCRLWVSSHNATFGSGTRFYCGSAADSVNMRLVRFGHVLVLPDSHQVALYVPQSSAERDHEHAYRGTGGDVGNVDIRQSDGSLSITVNDHQLLQVGGGDSGGSLVIRNSKGQALIDIRGDSNGGSIKIKDASGKTRVDVHGMSSDSHE